MAHKTAIWMGTAFAIALAVAALVLILDGAENAGVRLALELTARWSFLLFWLAYAGNSVAVLFGLRILAGHARDFGLAFASAHLVHIGLVIWLGIILGRAPLSGGLLLFFLIALFFTYLLAALAFCGVKTLGSAWAPLRFIAMNFFLISFRRGFLLPGLYPKPPQ